MKKLYLLVFVLGCCFSLSATTTNPGKMKAKKEVIEQELADLNQIEKIIAEEGLTYEQLAAKYPELVAKTNLSAAASEDGIMENASGTPLGIGGFWWGFCLGWVGMLIVYLTMDEGAARKQQVMNALWGCLIAYALFFIIYVGIVGASLASLY
ncbi:MAG: hypothetical protein IPN29_19355 [Saprospiraceae bacterium]|nr:hypothetical protein [Saprospiraceae bacterium]